jgi:type I restriction-modification system DNA methylase subunit
MTSRHIVRNVQGEPAKQFIKLLESLSYTRNRWEAFSDWTILASSALYNAFYKDPAIEKEYLDVAGRYNKDEMSTMCKMLAVTIEGLDTVPMTDFMGQVYAGALLTSNKLGQFFTPDCISRFMAQATFADVQPSNDRIITVCEPACGAGGMLLAVCSVLKEKDINFQRNVYIEATDIDPLCFRMTFIQLALVGASAHVVLGNTLAQTESRRWATPMFHLSFMSSRLARQQAEDDAKELITENANVNAA